MAGIFSVVSLICFLLAAVLLIVAVSLFFVLDVRGVYAEVRKRSTVQPAAKRKGKKAKAKQPPAQIPAEQPTQIEDEAVTVMENGQIERDPLVGVYEPGTELDAEERTMPQEMPTALEDAGQMPAGMQRAFWRGGAPEPEQTQPAAVQSGFELRRDILLADENNALTELIAF